MLIEEGGQVLSLAVRPRADPCGVRPGFLMNPCGIARTNPPGCRTDKIGRTDAARTLYLCRTDNRLI